MEIVIGEVAQSTVPKCKVLLFRHASVYILASIVLFIASSLAAYAVSNSVGGKANGATVSATVRVLGIDTT